MCGRNGISKAATVNDTVQLLLLTYRLAHLPVLQQPVSLVNILKNIMRVTLCILE